MLCCEWMKGPKEERVQALSQADWIKKGRKHERNRTNGNYGYCSICMVMHDVVSLMNLAACVIAWLNGKRSPLGHPGPGFDSQAGRLKKPPTKKVGKGKEVNFSKMSRTCYIHLFCHGPR